MGTIGSRNDARKVHRGKGRKRREKSGRYYRPEKEERSDAREEKEEREGNRAKGKRHFQSAKLGGLEMPNEMRGGELPQICDRNEK